VTRDTGQVVWELRFPKDYGVYRAERLSPLPLFEKDRSVSRRAEPRG
jgi:hypothetical protein